MNMEQFINWDPKQRDGWKYEWVGGVVQAFERSIKPEEKALLDRLIRAFVKSNAYTAGGNLFTETDFVLPGEDRVRRPDLAFYTAEQIAQSATRREQVPSFIIEILSPHDDGMEIERKLDDYFAAGVQCVWLVVPVFKFIRVLATRDHTDTYRSGASCSAALALPEFTVAVDSIFPADG
jgi:Uma2 family endonuclease